jgi:ribosomal protein L37E
MDGAVAGDPSWFMETVLLCDKCGHHGFYIPVDKEPVAETIKAIVCLRCGSEYPCTMFPAMVSNN